MPFFNHAKLTIDSIALIIIEEAAVIITPKSDYGISIAIANTLSILKSFLLYPYE